jgi:hypothetical protein
MGRKSPACAHLRARPRCQKSVVIRNQKLIFDRLERLDALKITENG